MKTNTQKVAVTVAVVVVVDTMAVVSSSLYALLVSCKTPDPGSRACSSDLAYGALLGSRDLPERPTSHFLSTGSGLTFISGGGYNDRQSYGGQGGYGGGQGGYGGGGESPILCVSVFADHQTQDTKVVVEVDTKVVTRVDKEVVDGRYVVIPQTVPEKKSVLTLWTGNKRVGPWNSLRPLLASNDTI